MIRPPKFSSVVIGGLTAAAALLAGPPALRADELADIRANQELLQRRLDQLSQAAPGGPGPYVPGYGPQMGPPGPNQPVLSGSFPRSFLIPGTDTSLRIGGFINADVLWYLKGAAAGSQLNGQGGVNTQTFFDGSGGTGNLASIPLNNTILHSRSSAFDMSPRYSRFLVETRTPTAWGQVKTYLEMDFSYNNTAVVNSSVDNVASGYLPRLRKAYGTFGGLLAGQDTGIMHDPDADAELIDTGGEATAAGRAREAQVKYTWTGPYGASFTVGGENPAPRIAGPFGGVDYDQGQIPTIAACSVTGNTTAALPATTACLGNAAFFAPAQSMMPDWIATARIDQPWGHLQVGGAVNAVRLNDGQFLDQTFVGYGGTASFDVHPFTGTPGPLGKDDFGGGFASGLGLGGQIANSAGTVATSFGKAMNTPVGFINPLTSAAWNTGVTTANKTTRQAYDSVVQTQAISSIAGWLWYQHWWTDQLRSTIEVSGIENGVNTNIVGPNTTNNKYLAMTHINLIWSPVGFVDFGAEYAYGHRVTVANFRGDSYTIQGNMRVRF